MVRARCGHCSKSPQQRPFPSFFLQRRFSQPTARNSCSSVFAESSPSPSILSRSDSRSGICWSDRFLERGQARKVSAMPPEFGMTSPSRYLGLSTSGSGRPIHKRSRLACVMSMRTSLAVCLSMALFLAATPMLALDPSIANTQYGVSSWSSADGLPQNFVGAIAQTPDGYLWFATEEGLARFDGARFTTFLDRRSIGALLVTHDGSLWISVLGSLVRYKDHKMTRYPTPLGLRG